MTRQPAPASARRCGGIFQPDPDLPPDHHGRETCRCGLVGEPGDAHHRPAEVGEDVQRRAAGDAQ